MDSRAMISRTKGLPKKPILLKDYLLDDLSSCSSNGFKSFPRRQCCTTVRFLLEIELKNKQQEKNYLNVNKNPPEILKRRPKSALSAFQSVISAVKRFPFTSGISPEKKKLKTSFLPRSFSKKILKKSGLWKKKTNHKEIQRWKSFDELLKEDHDITSDLSNSSITTTTGRKSNSWSGSDFTVSTLECSSGNSSSEVNLVFSGKPNDGVETQKVHDKNVGAPNDGVSTSTTGNDASASTDSSTNIKKQWPNEEKEQFSPVSVLDCPFDDEDEISSPFRHKLDPLAGTKKNLIKKIQRFDYLAQLEPVNLTKRFTIMPESDRRSNNSSADSIEEKFVSDIKDEREEKVEDKNETEEMALQLLNQLKDTLPSYGLRLKADKLLLDFFGENIVARNKDSQRHCSFDEDLLEEAECWIKDRKPRESLAGWELQKNREAYMKDMERGVEWKRLDQENHEVGFELESEVFVGLLNELLLDIISPQEIL